MPDMWMDVDVAVQVPANLLPLIDPTDFKTIEDAIAYNEAGMALVWNFVTTAGVQTATAFTPTTAGVHDWLEEGTDKGMYSVEIPASAGTVNNDTEGFGWISGETTNCLPFRGPTIGFRAAALNNALIDGGDELDVNVTKVAGTAQTANDMSGDINTILARIIGTLAAGTHNPQGGDTYARLGAPAAASIAADLAVIDNFVDELESRLTALRASYFDKLNITGNVAASSEVTAIQNNTRVRVIVPPMMERPDSGSTAFKLHLYIYDEAGNMEAPDSVPTITAENETGASRAGNLGTVTLEGTGHYSVAYTVATAHAIEQLIFEWTVTEGAVTRQHGAAAQIVDTTAVDFTAADRTKLDTLENHLTDVKGTGFVKDTHSLPQCLTASGFSTHGVADVWDRILSKANHNIGQSAGKYLRELGVLIAAEGAVSGTPTPTIFTTNITGYDDNFFKDQVIAPYNGANQAGQGRVVKSYTGSTGVFEVDEPFTTALNAGDDVVVFTPHVHAITEISAAIFNSQMTESYAADGVPPTLAQFNFMIWSLLSDFAIAGTTYTSRKLDGSTPAMTFTLNDPTTPTAMNRTA